MLNLFYSHATFELGGHYENDKFISTLGQDVRIDNVNGLRKIANLGISNIDYNNRETAIKYL
jgi:hypothetical protein